jgi:ribonuclease-3
MPTLADQLGHTFRDPTLLDLALTHRSVSSDDPTRFNNERLEFLGDAVLQLVVTDYLYSRFPGLAEGMMAKVRAAVVSGPTLSEVARGIGLGGHVELTAAEERTGGRDKDSIIADAMEAILGAVYLDGGLEAAAGVVLRLLEGRIADKARTPGLRDYKTRLQEVLAKDARSPEYVTTGSGPDHQRVFVATVSVDGVWLGQGEGRSKKDAEQGAAEQAIESLKSRSV